MYLNDRISCNFRAKKRKGTPPHPSARELTRVSIATMIQTSTVRKTRYFEKGKQGLVKGNESSTTRIVVLSDHLFSRLIAKFCSMVGQSMIILRRCLQFDFHLRQRTRPIRTPFGPLLLETMRCFIVSCIFFDLSRLVPEDSSYHYASSCLSSSIFLYCKKKVP